MSEQTEDPTETTTVANIQRMESGYFDHLQSLRERVPVGEYIADPETNRLALTSMVVVSAALLVLFPLTMFYSYTYLVIVVYLLAFVGFGKVFYDRVLIPHEETDTWED